MKLATGDVLAWLNADDTYFPWTLRRVAKLFGDHPHVNWAAGIPAYLDPEGELSNVYNTISARPSGLIKAGRFRKGLYGYLQQWPLPKSLALACACGSLSTRAAGGTNAQATTDGLQDALDWAVTQNIGRFIVPAGEYLIGTNFAFNFLNF